MPARLEHGLRQQEAVGRDQVDLRVARPARQQRLQHARGRALPHRHAAGDADDERHARALGSEERGGGAVQVLRRADVEIQQARQRQVDVGDLVERHPLVEADEASQLRLGQRQRRRRAQPRPLGAGELDEPRDGDLLAAAGHQVILALSRRRPATTARRATVMSQGHHGCRNSP